jgi:RHS repeat-associated protein
MSVSSLKILRLYHYDPLNRLTSVGILASGSTQRFYQGNLLTTELGQQTQRTILRREAQPLAQQQNEAGVTETTLLATDQADSLLKTLSSNNPQQLSYAAYGYHPAKSGLSALIGFNGECPDAITGHYPLGQGNRFFNPVLMRFNSPDELSPFDERAGINQYAYCGGDPTNFVDPTGNIKLAVILRGRNIPTPVIRSPLNTTRDTTSAITKNPGKVGLNPRPNALLNQSVPASPSQPRNTSALASQEVPVPPLRKTQRYAPKDSNPSTNAKVYRQLVTDAKRYDRHVSQPDVYPTAPRKMVEKLQSAKHAFEDANERTHSKVDINRRAANYRSIELKLKAHVIRNLDDNINR